MWTDNVRTTPPVGADALANSPLARGCVAAWFASSGYDHAGQRVALNSDKTNCVDSANSFGKAIRFTGSQGPAAYVLSNKAGYVLENATGMTVLMAATVQTGAARTLVSATGTITADNSWSVSVNSSGILSFYVSNASSSSRTYASTAAITSNKRGIFGAVWRGSDDLCGLYIDGVEVAGTKAGSARTNIDPTISLPISIGAPAVATNNKLVGSVEWMLVFNRALSPAEIRSLTENPYQIVAANAPLWLDVVSGGGGGVSGTLAASDVADTASLAGTISAPSATGTLAASDAPDAGAFAGALTFTGSLAATEAQDAATFSGTAFAPGVSGTLAAADSADSAVFAGALSFVAALAAVEPQDSAVVTGAFGPSGSLAAADLQDSAAFSGVCASGVDGLLVAVDQPDSAVFSGVADNGGLSIVVDHGRVLVVPRQSRSITIAAESRALTIAPQSRVLTIQGK